MSDVVNAAKNLEFKKTIVLALTSAIGLTIALYWKDAIQNIIDTLVPKEGRKIMWEILIALFVTIIGIVIIYLLAIFLG